jgi:hypothetical protein
MANKITGAVIIKVNGDPILNKAGAVASGLGLSGEASFEVEPVMGDGQFHGFKETPIMPTLEVSITDRSDVKLDTYARIGIGSSPDSVTFESRVGSDGKLGKIYTLQNPVCTRNFKITAGEGETTIKFIGDYWQEQSQVSTP